MRKHVLLYGVLCGVLIAGLQFIEYRWLVVEYSVELYGALVAAVFASVGIRLGLRLTRRTETVRQLRHSRTRGVSSGASASQKHKIRGPNGAAGLVG